MIINFISFVLYYSVGLNLLHFSINYIVSMVFKDLFDIVKKKFECNYQFFR